MQELHLSKKTEYEKSTEDNQNNKKIEIYKAGMGRRVIAFAFDALCTFILMIFIQSCVTEPIAKKTANVGQTEAAYVDRLLESGLYSKNPNDETDEIIYTLPQLFDKLNEGNDEKIKAFDFYDTKITNFYNTFELYGSTGGKVIHISSYYDLIKENVDLFTYSETPDDVNTPDVNEYAFTYVPKTEYSEVAMSNFYKNAYELAQHGLASDPKISEYGIEITKATVIEVIISTSVPVLIFFFVIPMCIPGGKTLGKLLLKLGVVNRGTGFAAKKTQILVRFVVFFFLELVASVLLFMVPALVSFTILAFSKEHNCIHDYLSATIVVDTSKSRLFKNEYDYLNYQALLTDASSEDHYVNSYRELNFNKDSDEK